jgi:hypothetical protein
VNNAAEAGSLAYCEDDRRTGSYVVMQVVLHWGGRGGGGWNKKEAQGPPRVLVKLCSMKLDDGQFRCWLFPVTVFIDRRNDWVSCPTRMRTACRAWLSDLRIEAND